MTKDLGARIVAVVLLALSLSGCTGGASPTQQARGPIVVASKVDTEGALLAQVIIAMLRGNGFTVVDRSQLGPTELVRKAIISGEVDIYPEYTGNGAIFFPEYDSRVWKDAAGGYEAVKRLDRDRHGIVWLAPAPANNTWAIAIPESLAEGEGIRSLEDFAAYVNRGGRVKLAGSEEFVNSPAALPAFQAAYGFVLRQDQLLTLSGGNTALTEKAAAEGTDGVNAAMAYGTDGSLSALGLVVLSDPKAVQPVYEPAAIVRGPVFARYPELATILGPVFQSLDLETLQALNAGIAVQGQNAAAVARAYLASRGFLPE